MKIKKVISILLSLFILSSTLVYAEDNVVITLGNELNQNQRQEMLNLFNEKEGSTKILVITNEEERRYLEGVATEKQLGTRAISSAYVEKLNEGEGITVKTHNLTWVTEEMIMNALVTAGVTDANIIAAAPFEVSGTAALTGILKAFEEITGTPISEEQKKIANEEVITTGELGEEIGKESASTLVREVKEIIVEKKLKDPEEIKKVIIEIAGNLNITLNQNQIDDISQLMEKINKLNLNTDAIREQLKGIGKEIKNISENSEEVKSLLGKVLDFLRKIIDQLSRLLTK
ncbi:MAG: DUF1002 domain-containing protein [Clostridiales bacterium]|nr:DUF1002 domain-containing protein [Clostridiales bacterium]